MACANKKDRTEGTYRQDKEIKGNEDKSRTVHGTEEEEERRVQRMRMRITWVAVTTLVSVSHLSLTPCTLLYDYSNDPNTHTKHTTGPSGAAQACHSTE